MTERGEQVGGPEQNEQGPDEGLIAQCLIVLESQNSEADPEIIAEAAYKAAGMLASLSEGIAAGHLRSVTLNLQLKVRGEVLDMGFMDHETTDQDREFDAKKPLK